MGLAVLTTGSEARNRKRHHVDVDTRWVQKDHHLEFFALAVHLGPSVEVPLLAVLKIDPLRCLLAWARKIVWI